MKKSLILNILIIILEIVGIIAVYTLYNNFGLIYYTIISNILMLISSSLFVGYMINNKEIPKWLSLFKYMSTICVTLTFLVVVFILAPMYNFNYKHMLFENELLYLHFLCPILAIITLVFFDKLDIDKVFIGTSLTLVYAIILVTLNILKLVDGPYPFLRVYNQPIYISIMWFIIIIGMSYLIGLMLKYLYDKFNYNRKKV